MSTWFDRSHPTQKQMKKFRGWKRTESPFFLLISCPPPTINLHQFLISRFLLQIYHIFSRIDQKNYWYRDPSLPLNKITMVPIHKLKSPAEMYLPKNHQYQRSPQLTIENVCILMTTSTPFLFFLGGPGAAFS